MTLNAYLDGWLALLRTRVQPTTHRSYDDMIHSYLRPVLGSCRVGELTAHQLNLHFVYLLQQGGRRGGPLTSSTVKYAHAILRQALGEAVRDGLLDDNVAARAAPPRHDPQHGPQPDRLRTWDRAQASRFLELTAGDPLHDLWRVALATGMRRGELLGLAWEDVDLKVPQVRVRTSLTHVQGRPQLKSTKNGRGRVLALDAATAAAIARQPPPRHDEWSLVFARPDGRPWRPESITDRLPGRAHPRRLATARSHQRHDDHARLRPRAPRPGPRRSRRHRPRTRRLMRPPGPPTDPPVSRRPVASEERQRTVCT